MQQKRLETWFFLDILVLENHYQKIISEVPMAELKDFGSSLRSLTQGKAKFKLEFNNYQLVPPHIQESLVISNAVLSEV